MDDQPPMPPAPSPEVPEIQKPKRKYVRRVQRRQRVVYVQAPAPATPKPQPALRVVPQSIGPEFEGVSATECCDACTPDNCVISGNMRCAHPAKGGPSSADLMNPETKQRYNRVKRILGEIKLNLQHAG
jgi:hypothetical protein